MAGKELINKIRKKGICGTIKMIAVKWKKTERDLWNPPISRVRKDLIDRILRRGYSRIVIYENHFGYHNIMMQRPQHMLRNMGDEETLILYNSYYDIDFKDRRRITPIARHVYVLDLYYYRKYLLNALKQIEKKYVMVYSTDTVPVSRIKQYSELGFRIIYEYVDDINEELISRKKIAQIRSRHQYLLRAKNVLTVATADKLYKEAKSNNKKTRIVQISNGAECDKFVPESVTEDQVYRQWLKEDMLHVGYYGALAAWVDYDLLKRLADNEKILENPSLKVLSEHIDHYIWPGPMPATMETSLKKAGEDVFFNGVDIDTALDEAEANITKDMKNSTFKSVENLYEYAK